jgi:hypothetical protein
VLFVAGCTTSAGLEIDLAMPDVDTLRPVNMTAITVIATPRGQAPIESTSPLTGASPFAGGELPGNRAVSLSLGLRDVSNRLVGYGESTAPFDIATDRETRVSVPVRRPFVYASDGAMLRAFDPTLDARDQTFQSVVPGVTAPHQVLSLGGERLAVAGAASIDLVDTATMQVSGSIALPGPIVDVATVPGRHELAVAYTGGLAFVTTDDGNVQSVATSAPVDRITVAANGHGGFTAWGLVQRVAPPAGPLDACTGTSSVIAVDVDNPIAPSPTVLPAAVSDLAGSPDTTDVFAALPCTGQVARLSDGGVPTGMFDVPRAAAVAVAGGKVWAVGTVPSTPICFGASGNEIQCPVDAAGACASGGSPSGVLAYVTDGARTMVVSAPLDGSAPISLELPTRRETIVSRDDPALQHAQNLLPLSITPIDLVVLPSGQDVAVVSASTFFITQLTSTSATVVLPCLQATTSDWMTIDLANAAIAQRVRTSCDLVVGRSDLFVNWECGAPPEGEAPMTGSFVPLAVGAIYGAR